MTIMAYVTVTLAVGLEFDGPIVDGDALQDAAIEGFLTHPALQNPREAIWAGVDRIEYETGETR